MRKLLRFVVLVPLAVWGCMPSQDASLPDADPSDAGSVSDATSASIDGRPPSESSDAMLPSASADGGAAARCQGPALALQAIWPLPASTTPSLLAVDPLGNILLAGSFTGTATFDTATITSAGHINMFLAEYSATGHVVYARAYGDSGFDSPPLAIAVDTSGNAFLGGVFGNTLNFGDGTTPITAIVADAFAVKIDPSGRALWAQRFGWAGESFVSSGGYEVDAIAIAPDGDAVIAGLANGTITLGSRDWPYSPTGGGQPFVAKLGSTDGTVVWGNASGGTFSADHAHVAVDASGRTFLAGQILGGAGAWGSSRPNTGIYRVGFDPQGTPLWSRFDDADGVAAVAVDSAGRVMVAESALKVAPFSIGSFTFPGQYSSLSLLVSPVDGTVLSAAAIQPTAADEAAVDGRGNSFIAGGYWKSFSFAGTTLPQSGAITPMFLAAFDGQSRPLALAGLGTLDAINVNAVVVDPSGSGRIYVLANGQPTTTSVGPTPNGSFLALFGPDPCAVGVGPLGASTGDASDHGDLPPDGSAPVGPPDSGPMAACPASIAQAVSGAACPVAMGCSYSDQCCICTPTPCKGQPTTWTCTMLATPDASCPATPPANGSPCPSGLQCTYCAPGGRLLADCTAAGWESGYAQILCQ